MHFVAINPSAATGGAEISLLELLRRLPPHVRASVILPNDGHFRQCCEEAGIKVHIVEWPEILIKTGERSMVSSLLRISTVMAILRTARALRVRLSEIHPDVVLTNGLKAHMMGALACRSNYLLVWYLREGLERRKKSAILLRLLSRYCQCSIAISDYVRDSWQSITGAKPVKVIYNIVDLAAFADAHRPTDLVKKPGEVWFCVIGALTPIKGQDLFIEAAALARATLPNARFLIAGTNFYGSESDHFEHVLRERVTQLDLSDRVWFLGHRTDIPSLLRLVDVVVQPNRSAEGLGRTVLESMAAGVPVIAVNQWGPAEIVKQANSGLVFEPGNVHALSHAMLLLAHDAGLRAQFGNAGRAWTRRNLNPDELVRNFEGFIQAAVKLGFP